MVERVVPAVGEQKYVRVTSFRRIGHQQFAGLRAEARSVLAELDDPQRNRHVAKVDAAKWPGRLLLSAHLTGSSVSCSRERDAAPRVEHSFED